MAQGGQPHGAGRHGNPVVLVQPGTGLDKRSFRAKVGHGGLQGPRVAARLNLGVRAEGPFDRAAPPDAQALLRQRDGTEGGLPGEFF